MTEKNGKDFENHYNVYNFYNVHKQRESFLQPRAIEIIEFINIKQRNNQLEFI